MTANVVALNLYRLDNFDRPMAGMLLVVAIIVWTAYVLWAYDDHARRTTVLLALDLAAALATVALTPVVKGEFRATVGGFWVMGVVLAWAVHWHWRGGLAAAVVLSAADVAVRDSVGQNNLANVFLLLLGGPVVGYLCASLQQMAADRDLAERAAAAAAERARLARAVHDGVLQVLALVQRRGAEAGGELADLGRLAGEQESALRALIHQQDTLVDDATASASTDLAVVLAQLTSATVTVSTPGEPVPLPAGVASEVRAAVSACLDNVARHVGEDARAWVLLEAWEDRVVVSVRDEGPGIESGRLDAAESEGRLGVAQSILGRVADLGGTAELDTGSWGTEWELSVPRRAS